MAERDRDREPEDHFEPAEPGSLADQSDLIDAEGDDIRQYTGEPVETDKGWVLPQQQNFAGERNIAGGGEWPDPNTAPSQPPADEDDEGHGPATDGGPSDEGPAPEDR